MTDDSRLAGSGSHGPDRHYSLELFGFNRNRQERVGEEFHFDWLDKCLIAAEALIQASEDEVERVVVFEWTPDPKFQGGSVSLRQWIFEYDDEPNLIVKANTKGTETYWSSPAALLASLEGVTA